MLRVWNLLLNSSVRKKKNKNKNEETKSYISQVWWYTGCPSATQQVQGQPGPCATKGRPGLVVHTLDPSPREAEADESLASLLYIVSSRSVSDS